MEFSKKFKNKYEEVTGKEIKYQTVLEVQKTLEENQELPGYKELLDTFNKSHSAYIDIKKNGNTRD